jgi:tetratricopeptide (TPR) repeat protein
MDALRARFPDRCCADRKFWVKFYRQEDFVVIKRVLYVCAVVLALAGCASAENGTQETEVRDGVSSPAADEKIAHYNQGGEYYERHEFGNAIDQYTQALKFDPEFAGAYLGRGNAYSGIIRQDQAAADYQEAAKYDPEYACYARGYSAYVAGNYDLAISEFTRAIEEKVNLFAAYNDRGLAWAGKGDTLKALEDYNEALKINSASAFPYNNRANAYLLLGRYDEAVSDYSQAISLYPSLVFPHYGRGLAHYRRGEYDNAIADYTRAIELTPDSGFLYRLRGDAYYAKNERELAKADYESAKKQERMP